MKLFSSDGSLAMIAVGEAPIGIFAIGQVARGFIAIGQLAVGVVALGQGCVSVVGIGQGGIGITWFAGMLGFGGRGICIRLIPGLDPPRVAPQGIAFQSLFQGVPEGFVKVQVLDASNRTRLALNNQPLPIKMTPLVASGVSTARAKNIDQLYAHMKVVGKTIVCDRLVEIPGARATASMTFQIVRVVGLIVIAAIWWWAFTVQGM